MSLFIYHPLIAHRLDLDDEYKWEYHTHEACRVVIESMFEDGYMPLDKVDHANSIGFALADYLDLRG